MGSFKILFLIAILSTTMAYASDCSMEAICKASNTNSEIFDRKSKSGPLIKGGHHSPYASGCNGTNCEWKDTSRKQRLLDDVKARYKKIILNGRNPGTITRAEKNFLDAIEATSFINVLSDNKLARKCKEDCRDGGTNSNYLSVFGNSQGICSCMISEMYPDEFIIFSFAHELCHSEDLCKSKLKSHLLEATNGGESIVNCLEKNGFTRKAKDKAEEHKENSCESYSSDFKEASCDALGVQVLADFLKDNPFDRQHPENFQRVLGDFHRMTCYKKFREGAAHPSQYDRVEKVFLANTTIRSALSCEGNSQYNNCDYRPATFTSRRNRTLRVIE